MGTPFDPPRPFRPPRYTPQFQRYLDELQAKYGQLTPETSGYEPPSPAIGVEPAAPADEPGAFEKALAAAGYAYELPGAPFRALAQEVFERQMRAQSGITPELEARGARPPTLPQLSPGQMAEAAATEDATRPPRTHGEAIARGLARMGGEMTTDPVALALIGGGIGALPAGAARTAAHLGMTGLLGAGVVTGGKETYEAYQEQGGWTPEVTQAVVRPAVDAALLATPFAWRRIKKFMPAPEAPPPPKPAKGPSDVLDYDLVGFDGFGAEPTVVPFQRPPAQRADYSRPTVRRMGRSETLTLRHRLEVQRDALSKYDPEQMARRQRLQEQIDAIDEWGSQMEAAQAWPDPLAELRGRQVPPQVEARAEEAARVLREALVAGDVQRAAVAERMLIDIAERYGINAVASAPTTTAHGRAAQETVAEALDRLWGQIETAEAAGETARADALRVRYDALEARFRAGEKSDPATLERPARPGETTEEALNRLWYEIQFAEEIGDQPWAEALRGQYDRLLARTGRGEPPAPPPPAAPPGGPPGPGPEPSGPAPGVIPFPGGGRGGGAPPAAPGEPPPVGPGEPPTPGPTPVPSRPGPRPGRGPTATTAPTEPPRIPPKPAPPPEPEMPPLPAANDNVLEFPRRAGERFGPEAEAATTGLVDRLRRSWKRVKEGAEAARDEFDQMLEEAGGQFDLYGLGPSELSDLRREIQKEDLSAAPAPGPAPAPAPELEEEGEPEGRYYRVDYEVVNPIGHTRNVGSLDIKAGSAREAAEEINRRYPPTSSSYTVIKGVTDLEAPPRAPDEGVAPPPTPEPEPEGLALKPSETTVDLGRGKGGQGHVLIAHGPEGDRQVGGVYGRKKDAQEALRDLKKQAKRNRDQRHAKTLEPWEARIASNPPTADEFVGPGGIQYDLELQQDLAKAGKAGGLVKAVAAAHSLGAFVDPDWYETFPWLRNVPKGKRPTLTRQLLSSAEVLAPSPEPAPTPEPEGEGWPVSDETFEALNRYVADNRQEDAAEAARLFEQERAAFDGSLGGADAQVTVYRSGGIRPGTYQSYGLDPERLGYFKMRRGEPKPYMVRVGDIAFPGSWDDQEVVIDSSKVSPVAEGKVGPYEHLSPEEQLDLVGKGEKPAFLWDGDMDAAKALANRAKAHGLPYDLIERGDGYGDLMVGKDQAALQRLRDAIGDPVEEGRALGYSEADIQAYLDNRRELEEAGWPQITRDILAGKYKEGDTLPDGSRFLGLDDAGNILIEEPDSGNTFAVSPEGEEYDEELEELIAEEPEPEEAPTDELILEPTYARRELELREGDEVIAPGNLVGVVQGITQAAPTRAMPERWRVEVFIPEQPGAESARTELFDHNQLKRLGDALFFVSGQSRTKDLLVAALWDAPFGVDVGELSEEGVEQLGTAVARFRGRAFVDSGAYSLFKRSLKQEGVRPLDWQKVFDRYDRIVLAAAQEARDYTGRNWHPPIRLVMPDMVGDQEATLELLHEHADKIQDYIRHPYVEPIVPIQKGEMSLFEMAMEVSEALNRDLKAFTLGLPGHAKAVTVDEVAEFASQLADAYADEEKLGSLAANLPLQIHFLGVGPGDRLSQLASAVRATLPRAIITSDANRVRALLRGDVTRDEAIRQALGLPDDADVSKPDALIAAGPMPATLAAMDADQREGLIEWVRELVEDDTTVRSPADLVNTASEVGTELNEEEARWLLANVLPTLISRTPEATAEPLPEGDPELDEPTAVDRWRKLNSIFDEDQAAAFNSLLERINSRLHDDLRKVLIHLTEQAMDRDRLRNEVDGIKNIPTKRRSSREKKRYTEARRELAMLNTTIGVTFESIRKLLESEPHVDKHMKRLGQIIEKKGLIREKSKRLAPRLTPGTENALFALADEAGVPVAEAIAMVRARTPEIADNEAEMLSSLEGLMGQIDPEALLAEYNHLSAIIKRVGDIPAKKRSDLDQAEYSRALDARRAIDKKIRVFLDKEGYGTKRTLEALVAGPGSEKFIVVESYQKKYWKELQAVQEFVWAHSKYLGRHMGAYGYEVTVETLKQIGENLAEDLASEPEPADQRPFLSGEREGEFPNPGQGEVKTAHLMKTFMWGITLPGTKDSITTQEAVDAIAAGEGEVFGRIAKAYNDAIDGEVDDSAPQDDVPWDVPDLSADELSNLGVTEMSKSNRPFGGRYGPAPKRPTQKQAEFIQRPLDFGTVPPPRRPSDAKQRPRADALPVRAAPGGGRAGERPGRPGVRGDRGPGDEGAPGVGPAISKPTPGVFGVVLARPEETAATPVDYSLIPEKHRPLLGEHQHLAVAKIIAQLKQGKGFLLADGTGVGKTHSIMSTAYHFAQNEKRPVIIVAPPKTINVRVREGREVPTGSYAEAAPQLGVNLTYVPSGERPFTPEPGRVYLTTYWRLEAVRATPETIVIFDEAHYLKNFEDKGERKTPKGGIKRAFAGKELGDKAYAVLFATATPGDTPDQLIWSERIGLLEGKTLARQMHDLGMHVRKKKVKVTGPDGKKMWVDKHTWSPTLRSRTNRRLRELHERLTARGAVLKREIDMSALDVEVRAIPLPQEAHDLLRRIEIAFPGGGQKKALMLQHQRRQQEPYKLEAVKEAVRSELAQGRQVVVFASRVNYSKAEKKILDEAGEQVGTEIIAESEGTLRTLGGWLADEGIEFAEVHGGASEKADVAIERFQSGQAQVLIATVEKGGEGINLDDRTGDRPRSMVIMTAPFSSVEMFQAVGRIHRYTTMTSSRIIMLKSDAAVDEWNFGINATKMANLGARVSGQVELLRPDLLSEWGDDVDTGTTSQPQAQYSSRYIEGILEDLTGGERIVKPIKSASQRNLMRSRVSSLRPKWSADGDVFTIVSTDGIVFHGILLDGTYDINNQDKSTWGKISYRKARPVRDTRSEGYITHALRNKKGQAFLEGFLDAAEGTPIITEGNLPGKMFTAEETAKREAQLRGEITKAPPVQAGLFDPLPATPQPAKPIPVPEPNPTFKVGDRVAWGDGINKRGEIIEIRDGIARIERRITNYKGHVRKDVSGRLLSELRHESEEEGDLLKHYETRAFTLTPDAYYRATQYREDRREWSSPELQEKAARLAQIEAAIDRAYKRGKYDAAEKLEQKADVLRYELEEWSINEEEGNYSEAELMFDEDLRIGEMSVEDALVRGWEDLQLVRATKDSPRQMGSFSSEANVFLNVRDSMELLAYQMGTHFKAETTDAQLEAAMRDAWETRARRIESRKRKRMLVAETDPSNGGHDVTDEDIDAILDRIFEVGSNLRRVRPVVAPNLNWQKPQLAGRGAELKYEAFGGARRLYSVLAEDLSRFQEIDWISGDYKVFTVPDVGAVAGIARNTSIEQGHLVFIKNGQIVKALQVSSSVPVSIAWATKRSIEQLLKVANQIVASTEADTVVMLHNHPSGEARPSQKDLEFDKKLRTRVASYEGSVVIDHENFYAVTWETGSQKVTPYMRAIKTIDQDPLLQAGLDAHEWYRGGSYFVNFRSAPEPGGMQEGKLLPIEKFVYAQSLMLRAAAGPDAKDWPLLLLLDAKNQLREVLAVPPGIWGDRDLFRGYVQEWGKTAGATWAVVALDRPSTADRAMAQVHMTAQGKARPPVLFDAIDITAVGPSSAMRRAMVKGMFRGGREIPYDVPPGELRERDDPDRQVVPFYRRPRPPAAGGGAGGDGGDGPFDWPGALRPGPGETGWERAVRFAEARMRARLREASSGIDPRVFWDALIIGADRFARGIRNFATWMTSVGEFRGPSGLWRKIWSSLRGLLRPAYVEVQKGGKLPPADRAIESMMPQPKVVRPVREPTARDVEKAMRMMFEEGPQAPGKPPKLAININQVETANGVREALSRMVRGAETEFGKAKGYRSWQEVEKLALKAGLTEKDVRRLLKEKGVLTDYEVYAARVMRQEATADFSQKFGEWRDLARRAEAETDPVQKAAWESMAFEAQRDAQAALHKAMGISYTTVAAGAEAGRALAIHRLVARELSPEERLIRQIFRDKKLNWEDRRIQEIAEALEKGDMKRVGEIYTELYKPTFLSKVLEWWLNAILSGPPTHAANVTGNTTLQAIGAPERAISSRLEQWGIRPRLEKWLTGNEVPPEREIGEAIRAFKTLVKMKFGVWDALKVGWHALWNPDAVEGFGAKGEYRPPAIGGRLGRIVRAPSRAMEGADLGAKAAAAGAERDALTWRMAMQEAREARKAGNEWTKEQTNARADELAQVVMEYRRIEENRKLDPAQLTPEERVYLVKNKWAGEVNRRMDHAADVATFRDETMQITKYITLIRARYPWLTFMIPFIKTPERIFVQAFRRTPLGLVRTVDNIRRGKLSGGEASDRLAQGILGTMMSASVYMLAREGLITGSGPADPRKRRDWLATGKRPYAARIGDTWVSFARIEPLATTFGFAADLAEAQDDRVAGDLWDKLHYTAIQNITNKTFLEGMISTAEAVGDPDRYGARLYKRMLGGFVPNLLATAARAIDPTIRQNESIQDTFMGRVPWLSTMVPPKLSGTGELIDRGEDPLSRFISPFRYAREAGPEKNLERMFLETGYSPSAPPRSMTLPGTMGRKVMLTNDERQLYARYVQRATAFARTLTANADFSGLDVYMKAELLRRMYRFAHDAARRGVYRSVLQRLQSGQYELKEI